MVTLNWGDGRKVFIAVGKARVFYDVEESAKVTVLAIGTKEGNKLYIRRKGNPAMKTLDLRKASKSLFSLDEVKKGLLEATAPNKRVERTAEKRGRSAAGR